LLPRIVLFPQRSNTMKQAQFILAVSALVAPSFLLTQPAIAKPKAKAHKEQAAPEPARHQIDEKDLKAIESVPVPLKQAIETAESKTGAKLVDIAFDADTGKYDAVLVKDQSIIRAKIDANSGAVEQQPARKSKDDKEAIQEAKALQGDFATLPAMIGAVEEQHGGAKTVEADVQLFGDFVIYDMHLAKNGAGERVAIEAKSGRPIANPRALESN
jgi:uncharacterized membrane protein YkoI